GAVRDGPGHERAAPRRDRPAQCVAAASRARDGIGPEPVPARVAPLHHQFVAGRAVEELGRFVVTHDVDHGHEPFGCAPRISVPGCPRVPPLPLTRTRSCRSTWRPPPWPRVWITPSESGVMPHM